MGIRKTLYFLIISSLVIAGYLTFLYYKAEILPRKRYIRMIEEMKLNYEGKERIFEEIKNLCTEKFPKITLTLTDDIVRFVKTKEEGDSKISYCIEYSASDSEFILTKSGNEKYEYNTISIDSINNFIKIIEQYPYSISLESKLTHPKLPFVLDALSIESFYFEKLLNLLSKTNCSGVIISENVSIIYSGDPYLLTYNFTYLISETNILSIHPVEFFEKIDENVYVHFFEGNLFHPTVNYYIP